MRQPDGLIQVLRDDLLPYGDRDDAAMDLHAFDEPEVAKALSEVALDPVTDPDLAESCAESLARIWCRKGTIDRSVLSQLRGSAFGIAVRIVEFNCPSLLPDDVVRDSD